MLNNPNLALCANRSILPKRNEKSGSPEDWFTNDMLSRLGLVGVNIDFFVDWSEIPNTLTPIIWIKQVLSQGKVYSDFLVDVKNNLVDRFGEVFLRTLHKFSLAASLQINFIILDDQQDWNDSESEVCLVSVSDHFAFNEEMLSISTFKKLVQTYSGGPVHIGNKGLIYGTTNLECVLSRTDSAYPGDMDMLLLNENAEPVAILEFKKHTLSPDISGQTLSNYYPKPDGRKYDRLTIFREYVFSQQGLDIPIILIFYPSNVQAEYGLAEVLTGSPGSLKVKVGRKFKLPVDTSDSERQRILGLIPKVIELYKG